MSSDDDDDSKQSQGVGIPYNFLELTKHDSKFIEPHKEKFAPYIDDENNLFANLSREDFELLRLRANTGLIMEEIATVLPDYQDRAMRKGAQYNNELELTRSIGMAFYKMMFSRHEYLHDGSEKKSGWLRRLRRRGREQNAT